MELWKVPRVERSPWAFIALAFNVVPGIGTMMAGARTGNIEHWLHGLLQFLAFILGVGLTTLQPMLSLIALAAWIWGLTWGVLIVVRSQ